MAELRFNLVIEKLGFLSWLIRSLLKWNPWSFDLGIEKICFPSMTRQGFNGYYMKFRSRNREICFSSIMTYDQSMGAYRVFLSRNRENLLFNRCGVVWILLSIRSFHLGIKIFLFSKSLHLNWCSHNLGFDLGIEGFWVQGYNQNMTLANMGLFPSRNRVAAYFKSGLETPPTKIFSFHLSLESSAFPTQPMVFNFTRHRFICQ